MNFETELLCLYVYSSRNKNNSHVTMEIRTLIFCYFNCEVLYITLSNLTVKK